MASILLIHPPVAKPCEPPAGIAVLAGALGRAGIRCAVLDLNLMGLEGLVRRAGSNLEARDTWTRRAQRHRERNLDLIRRPEGYVALDQSKRIVADLNRLVDQSTSSAPVRISLANYQDSRLSPTRSQDLVSAAEHPETNPFFPFFSHQLSRAMESARPAVVGFSLNYLSQALCTFALIGLVRRRWPGVAVLLGGGLVTSWLRGPNWIKSAFPSQDEECGTERTGESGSEREVGPFRGLVDAMIAGSGEAALLRWFGKTASEASALHGLPDYGRFALDGYFAPGPILPYAASRGCYWNRCAFCPESAEGNKYRPVERDRAAAELGSLVQTHRPVLLHLVDNALSPALLDELIRRPPGAPWYGFVRFSRRLADPDYCRALRRAGCVMLKLGLESGSQAVLDREGKGVNLGVAGQVLEGLRVAGIAAYVYLLFGTPSESADEARDTLEFTVRHGQKIGFLNLALFNLPLAGRGRAGLELLPSADDLSLYAGFRHPKGWDRATARRFLDQEFRRHPVIAAILRRDPLLFTSNHAPFFAEMCFGDQARAGSSP